MEFKKAERKQAKLRLALCGVSGGGKTYSSLLIAKGLAGKIAMIDTEHGSGSLYANTSGMPEYAVMELDPPFSPQRYIEAIRTAEAAGFDTIIIDSLTHAWAGDGGVLEMHDKATAASKSGNSYTAWKDVTPEQNKLVNAILQSKCHIIATLRTKQEYALVLDDRGKQQPKKMGMAPIQREGIEFEFTVVLDISTDNIASASKDRTGLFKGKAFAPDIKTGEMLLEWLSQGIIPEPSKQPESKPASAELGKLFWKACKAAGNNPDTNEGIANIKAWIKKAGKTELPFCDLSPEKQGELIKMMQAEKLP